MVLDHVLTVAIGRVDRFGRTLSDLYWDEVRDMVFEDCDVQSRWYGGQVVAFGDVVGVTSDQLVPTEEDSYVVLIVNPVDVGVLRRELAMTLGTFGLSSACFASDEAHEPVFVGRDGYRAAPKTTAAEYAPVHGGYPG